MLSEILFLLKKKKGDMRMKEKVIVATVLTMILIGTMTSVLPIMASPDPIKIAVVGPQGWIQWDGMWVGAKMAQEKINNGGGILGHPVELIPVDEHAAETPPNPVAGWAELLTALEAGAQFVVGGFRTECVSYMRDEFVAYAKAKEMASEPAPLWFIAGASTDELIDCGYPTGHPLACGKCVRCDYNKYKYMFRVTPMNSTMLFKQFAMFLRTYILPTRLARMYGNYTGITIPVTPEHPFEEPVYYPPVKTYIVAEDLSWTVVMGACLAGKDFVPWSPYPTPPNVSSVLGPNCRVVGYARTHPVTPDFLPIFTDIDAQGVHLIIHIFSAGTGIDFIKMWHDRNTKAICVGINVPSQMQEFWDSVGGKCEYETFLATVGTNTSIIPGVTDALWDEYKAKSGTILTEWYGVPTPSTYPIYTFWGTYDAIMAIDESIESYGSWPILAPQLIPHTEKTNRQATIGRFRYTGTNGTLHDVFCDVYSLTKYWPPPQYVRALIVQWQAGSPGKMQVVWPQDKSYSRRFQIPPVMYNITTDLNYDGKVDMKDIGPAAKAFGSFPGHIRWNIEVDLNCDGKVDMKDIGAVAKAFGQKIEPWPLP